MSLIPAGLSIILASLEGLIDPTYVRSRSIGGFIADVTVEENHLDELMITEHPVEQGAAVTDHSYKRPASVTIRAGWSNSSPQSGGNPAYVQQVYDALLQLQADREPFDIITGKRFYQDMLIRRISSTTTEQTENALMVTCECQQVLITSTQTVIVPPSSQQRSPELTGATQNRGNISVVPANAYNTGAVPLTGEF